MKKLRLLSKTRNIYHFGKRYISSFLRKKTKGKVVFIKKCFQPHFHIHVKIVLLVSGDLLTGNSHKNTKNINTRQAS